jgi:hypothetical protein
VLFVLVFTPLFFLSIPEFNVETEEFAIVEDFPSIIFITFPSVDGLTKIGLGSS